MPDMMPVEDAAAASAKRAVEIARLDMIAANLKSSAVQVGFASAALLLAFAENVTGLGRGFDAWH